MIEIKLAMLCAMAGLVVGLLGGYFAGYARGEENGHGQGWTEGTRVGRAAAVAEDTIERETLRLAALKSGDTLRRSAVRLADENALLLSLLPGEAQATFSQWRKTQEEERARADHAARERANTEAEMRSKLFQEQATNTVIS